MSGHTPGPWRVAESGMWKGGVRVSTEYFVRRPDDDVGIANDIMDPETSKPSEANARLIAESPALLAFAKWAIGQLCGDSGTGESHWEQFQEFRDGQSAIAKAEGKQ